MVFTNEDTIEPNFSPSEVTVMKYAPITSCDVERFFSRYKLELRTNHRIENRFLNVTISFL